MLTEFHGEPVAGGTYPAEIWRAFVQSTKDSGSTFDSPPYIGGTSAWVVERGGAWRLDNGYCKGARLLVYLSGKAPEDQADCKPNEVAVPLVVGMTKGGAIDRLGAQPLSSKVVYKPARPGTYPGLVVDQFPRRGGLSANDEVTIVVTKARSGVLPNFVGSTFADAKQAAERMRLDLHVKTAPGRRGIVLRQGPRPGVATASGMSVSLVVGDGSRTANT
jgi:hypothetical protein